MVKSHALILLSGILLLLIEYIYEFNDFLGYCITTIGVLLCLLGVVLNKPLQKILNNFFAQFF